MICKLSDVPAAYTVYPKNESAETISHAVNAMELVDRAAVMASA